MSRHQKTIALIEAAAEILRLAIRGWSDSAITRNGRSGGGGAIHEPRPLDTQPLAHGRAADPGLGSDADGRTRYRDQSRTGPAGVRLESGYP
jgi:hypothetical protein